MFSKSIWPEKLKLVWKHSHVVYVQDVKFVKRNNEEPILYIKYMEEIFRILLRENYSAMIYGKTMQAY